MKWIEIVVHTTNEAVEAVSNILNEAGTNGVVIEDSNDLTRKKRTTFGEIYELNDDKYPTSGVFVKGYFSESSNIAEKIHQLKTNISNLTAYGLDIGPNTIFTNIVQEEDWANEWKKYFKPVKVSEKFVIVPSWEEYETTSNDELIILLDPGMAFGTGTHPTTVLSLRALEQYVKKDDIVLDVGSGSGVLSIGAILLQAQHVYSFDLDEIAVKSTINNRDLNNMQNKITVEANDLLKGIKQQANIVVSNILAEILENLVDDAWDNLQDGGYFITSGIIDSKYESIRKRIENKGFTIIKVNELDKWVSIIAKKQ